MRAGFCGKVVIAALTNEDVEMETTDEALALIISALGHNPLRAAQNCTIAKEAWAKLQVRYAGNSLINKLGVLNSLLNLKFIEKIKRAITLRSWRPSFLDWLKWTILNPCRLPYWSHGCPMFLNTQL